VTKVCKTIRFDGGARVGTSGWTAATSAVVALHMRLGRPHRAMSKLFT